MLVWTYYGVQEYHSTVRLSARTITALCYEEHAAWQSLGRPWGHLITVQGATSSVFASRGAGSSDR